jgi:hypothetical protein
MRPNEGESTLGKDAIIRYYLHGDKGKGGRLILRRAGASCAAAVACAASAVGIKLNSQLAGFVEQLSANLV